MANLYNSRGSIDSFARLLERRRPDVLACVEVGVSMARALRTIYPHGVVEGDDLDYSGRGLLAAHPIEVDALSLAHRDGLRTSIELSGVATEVVLAHLANPVHGIPAFRDRRAQVDGIISHLDRVGTPAVLAGDLNATPLWPAYRRLRRRLRDGVLDAARRESRLPARTWAPRPGWPSMLRIDHILTAGVRLEDVAVHRVEGSDHRAVSARLVRVEPSGRSPESEIQRPGDDR